MWTRAGPHLASMDRLVAMLRLGEVDWTVIVAVLAMWVVEMTIDEVIDVIAMWHGLMATSRPMHMSRLMTSAAVIWRAPIWVFCAHRYHMFFHVILVRMMEMAIMRALSGMRVFGGLVHRILDHFQDVPISDW